MSTQVEVENFKVLSLFLNAKGSSHEVFMKEHNASNYNKEEKPLGRTLFLINIPPYADTSSLKPFFSQDGKVEVIESTGYGTAGFKIGFIVFENHQSLLEALKLEKLERPVSNKFPISVGLKKWACQYNSSINDHQKLQKIVKESIISLDQIQEERDTEEKDVTGEGWKLVTKKSRNRGGLPHKTSVGTKLIENIKQKSHRRELTNFYTFQKKEQKIKNLVVLRNNFQESKQKVEKMKKCRNFKPY